MVQIMFKHVVSITYYQLEYNDGTSLDIYESFGDVNDEIRKVVGWGIDRRVGIDVGGEVGIGDDV